MATSFSSNHLFYIVCGEDFMVHGVVVFESMGDYFGKVGVASLAPSRLLLQVASLCLTLGSF
jgi:hypothetical protein